MTAAHSHTGLFADRSHTSSSLGFIKAVCSKVQVVTKRNSKCRNGERGMPAAKRKAQVILCVLPSIFATQMACRSCRSGAWNCGELPQEKKQGSESLRRPAACYPYAPGFAHGETGTDCRSKLHMHMHIIIVLLRLIVVYPFPQVSLSTRLASMLAVYAPFAGMSTLSLHIYAREMQI